MEEVEVLVIGGGTAGEYAARAAKKNARSVGLVEKGRVGGECVFHACIPTKSLVHAARTYKEMHSADFYGLPVLNQTVDYKMVKAFKDRIIDNLGAARDEKLTKAGIRVFQGTAQFVSPHQVKVGNDVILADKIIITTGSLPSVPPIPGLREAGFITSTEALELESLPPRIAIIGGGAVGVEFAQIFSSFGSRVHIYEALARILIAEDEEVSRLASDLFQKQGIAISASAAIVRVQAVSSARQIVTRGQSGREDTEEFDVILVAAGRRPGIDDLNLAGAGVETNKKGILVNSALQSNVPHIWAAGDVAGISLFTLIAWEQGYIAGLNASTGQVKSLDYNILPRATFCDPEIASVGLTEKQANEKGLHAKSAKYDFANLTRSIITDKTDGFIKIVAEESTGRILGGHIIGEEASTLIHEVAAAMANNATVSDVGRTLHAYPTLSEGVRYACQALM